MADCISTASACPTRSSSSWGRRRTYGIDATLATVSPPSAIGRDALVGEPQSFRRRGGLVEDVDGDAAARIPVTADAQPQGLDRLDHTAGDGEGAVLVERAVIAECAEIELQRLALDQPLARHVVDDEMREIGLAGDRTERSEFRAGEAHEVGLARMRVGDLLQQGLIGRGGGVAPRAELLPGARGRPCPALFSQPRGVALPPPCGGAGGAKRSRSAPAPPPPTPP